MELTLLKAILSTLGINLYLAYSDISILLPRDNFLTTIFMITLVHLSSSNSEKLWLVDLYST